VLDNIRLSKPEATEEEVARCGAQLDCLDIFEHYQAGCTPKWGAWQQPVGRPAAADLLRACALPTRGW